MKGLLIELFILPLIKSALHKKSLFLGWHLLNLRYSMELKEQKNVFLER